jgi:hypothetical protein
VLADAVVATAKAKAHEDDAWRRLKLAKADAGQ